MGSGVIRVDTYDHEQIVNKLTDFHFMQEIREQGRADSTDDYYYNFNMGAMCELDDDIEVLTSLPSGTSCSCQDLNVNVNLEHNEKIALSYGIDTYYFDYARRTPYLDLYKVEIFKKNVLTTTREVLWPVNGIRTLPTDSERRVLGTLFACLCKPYAKDTQRRRTEKSLTFYIGNNRTGEKCSFKVETNAKGTVNEVTNTCSTLSNDMVVEGLYDYLGAE
jgi:hypothetical protein